MVVELRNRTPTITSTSNDIIKKETTTTIKNSPKKSKKSDKKNRIDGGRIRSGLEIPRKLLHSSISILSTLIYLSKPNLNLIILVMFTFLIIVISADILRFRNERFEVYYESKLGLFMRESERNEVNGVIYYLLGVLICLTFYPKDIACLSIIILSLCDTAASIIGRLLGRFTSPLPFSGTIFGANKSLAGTMGGVVMGCLASYIFWTKIASGGDQIDCSWIPARLASTYIPLSSSSSSSSSSYSYLLTKSNELLNFIPKLSNPNSSLPLWLLVLSNGAVAGLAEAIDVFGLDDNLSLPVLFGGFAYCFMWFSG